MANRVRAAHDALEQLLASALGPAEIMRNPGGHRRPHSRGPSERALYVALDDDEDPEVEAVLCGPVYDLKVSPVVTLAVAGGASKDERRQAAYAELDKIATAIAADRTLGGAADYVEIEGAPGVDVADTDWLAGGLEVRIGILLTAPTRAG